MVTIVQKTNIFSSEWKFCYFEVTVESKLTTEMIK